MDPTYFTLKKDANQNDNLAKRSFIQKICKWKTSLIDQANGNKIVYLSADPNASLFKSLFNVHLYVEYYIT